MIQGQIVEVRQETVTDLLGPDGSQRSADYPCVLVHYSDPDTDTDYGTASYPIRPGSAIQSIDDVTQAIKATIPTLVVPPEVAAQEMQAEGAAAAAPAEPLPELEDLQQHIDTIVTPDN